MRSRTMGRTAGRRDPRADARRPGQRSGGAPGHTRAGQEQGEGAAPRYPAKASPAGPGGMPSPGFAPVLGRASPDHGDAGAKRVPSLASTAPISAGTGGGFGTRAALTRRPKRRTHVAGCHHEYKSTDRAERRPIAAYRRVHSHKGTGPIALVVPSRGAGRAWRARATAVKDAWGGAPTVATWAPRSTPRHGCPRTAATRSTVSRAPHNRRAHFPETS
jgi:hypothetical protein